MKKKYTKAAVLIIAILSTISIFCVRSENSYGDAQKPNHCGSALNTSCYEFIRQYACIATDDANCNEQ